MNIEELQSTMPCYQSHKKVSALKIKTFERKLPSISELEEILRSENAGNSSIGGIITPEDAGYAPFEVTQQYVAKHDPQAGGYYVVYADGYQSFSPAEAFESGYTLIS